MVRFLYPTPKILAEKGSSPAIAHSIDRLILMRGSEVHFDDTFNSKQQGNVAVSFAIAYYTQKKWVVSIPLNDSQDYDLLVEDTEGYIYKVQVKSTRFISRNGNYEVSLKSSGGTNGSKYKEVCKTSVDYLFIMTAAGIFYEVPLIELEPVQSMALGSKYEKYKITIW